jgi:hypothetical protein
VPDLSLVASVAAVVAVPAVKECSP